VIRRIPFLLVPMVLCSTFGCGEPASNLNLKPSPSGGAMTRLPGNRGLVAIKTEGPASARGGKTKTKARTTTIVASFYQSDGTTPMTPAPTDVVLKLGVSDDPKAVTLSPDSREPHRFASSPGPYPNGLQGTIHAKINGEDIQESFSSL
jgi:hypothetical protein